MARRGQEGRQTVSEIGEWWQQEEPAYAGYDVSQVDPEGDVVGDGGCFARLDDAAAWAEVMAGDASEGGRTGRAEVRAADGFLLYSVQVRGTYRAVFDHGLGDGSAVYVDGEYAYLKGFAPERDRYKARRAGEES